MYCNTRHINIHTAISSVLFSSPAAHNFCISDKDYDETVQPNPLSLDHSFCYCAIDDCLGLVTVMVLYV